ncbi:uncharacterized protein [Parasteatoda tepidariorum]|uniref:uncharacterized protein n=1 Tax=Parasteatoda tepidariorum TaxID=114398 RepID=UPI0039BD33A3
MEYATPVWSHSSSTSRERLDKVQAKAAKIMSGAVSSTNNLRIQEECGLVPLEERRQMLTVKFTNNAHSLDEGHISHRTIINWNKKSRHKKSSPLLFDRDIREKIHLKPEDFLFRNETPATRVVPVNTTICLELIEPCSKKYHANKLKEIGMKTIDSLSGLNHVRAFTDGSSDSTFPNGGAGVVLLLPDDQKREIATGAGKIASNFTAELIAISTAIETYINLEPSEQLSGIIIFSDCRSALQALSKGTSSLILNIIEQLGQLQRLRKKCFLQWISAHVNLEFNEIADSLAKNARDLNQKSIPTTF